MLRMIFPLMLVLLTVCPVAAEMISVHRDRLGRIVAEESWSGGAVRRGHVDAATAVNKAWQSKRISVVDRAPEWPVVEAARRWAVMSNVSPSVKVGEGDYPAHCPPLSGAVVVCEANIGDDYGWATTSYVRGSRGYIVAARIVFNSYWSFFPIEDPVRYYGTGHEFGHAFGGLPHDSVIDRPTSIMAARVNVWPDVQNGLDMNARYGGKGAK